MAAENCSLCNGRFIYQAKRKRFERSDIETKLKRREHSAKDILDHFIRVTPDNNKKTFICSSCTTKIDKCGEFISSKKGLKNVADESTYLGRKILLSPRTPTTPGRKRRRVTSTPVIKHQQKSMHFKTSSTRFSCNFKTTAAKYLSSSRYLPLFRSCIRNSKAAKVAFVQIVSELINQEMKTYCSYRIKDSVWRKGTKDGIRVFQNFSWRNAIIEAEKYCPTLIAALSSAVSQNKLVKQTGTKTISLEPNVGCIIGQLVFTRKPSMKFLQELIGLELWLSGTSRKSYSRLRSLGLTMKPDAVRSSVDRLRQNFDEELFKQKDKIVAGTHIARRRLFDVPDEQVEDHDGIEILNDTLPFLELDDELDDENDRELAVLDETFPYDDEEMEIDATEQGQDDVHLPEPNDPTKQCAYSLVFDNVNKHVHAKETTSEKQNQMKNMVQAYAAADRIPSMHLDNTAPTPAEVAEFDISLLLPNEQEIDILRKDFIKVVMDTMKDNLTCFRDVEFNVDPHEYIKESMKKSHIIPLGVLDKDETKIADMVDILEAYHKYVPGHVETDPFIIPLYGDQLSVERSYDAQNARINAADAWGQLQGLHPSIQEWHKRAILLQDTYKLLYKVKSARSIGTLLHIKNMYRHVNVKDDVHQCFNEATALLRFTTTAYIIATALTIMGCKSHSEEPSNFPTDKSSINDYAFRIADQIVDMSFQPPNTNVVLNADTSANSKYKYCLCKNDIGGEMIECGNRKCKKGKWFHWSCVDVNEDNTDMTLEWYCSSQCSNLTKTNSTGDDLVFEYTRLLLNRGISELVRHKALRQNDGNRIMIHWKEDMFNFFEFNHTKYFLCGQRLLMDTQGALSQRLAHQLRWNRTVNMKGGNDNNLEMDLQMEFFNREFKDSLKDAGGNISEKTMARHGEMVGVARQIGKIFDEICDVSGPSSNKSGKKNLGNDINDLVDLLLKKDCCKKLTVSRFHIGFGDVQLKTSTTTPVMMKKRMEKHVKKRSRRLRLINAR